MDWGRRSVLSAGGLGGSGGVERTDVRGSGRGGEDMAEVVTEVGLERHPEVGLERHPASESPSAESELVEPEGERDGTGEGGREESDSHAPRSARRWTASLGAAPHSSAWPTILGRGPVSLIEKFPVSSPDDGGDDDVRGSGEGGAGAGGEAIYLPVRGDGTSNVYHPYISNTLLPITNTSAAPSSYTASVYISRSGVAELLQRITGALVQHLARAPTFLLAQLSGGECIRLLTALALLQHSGSRPCYQVLARRLLQCIDTLSPHELCDVLWSLSAQAAATQSTRLAGAGIRGMAAAASTSESVSAETATTEVSAGGVAAAEGGGRGLGRVGGREEEGEEEVVEEDVLSRLFVEVSHRLFGWEEEEALNEEEETLRETQREMQCDAASHCVRGRIAATSLESPDDGQGEEGGEGEGEGEQELLCGALAPDGGGGGAQARVIQANAAALRNNAYGSLMHLFGAEDVALAAAAESRDGEGGFVALVPGTSVMQLTTHELADLAVAVAVAAHPSLRKSPAMQRICQRMMWGLRVRALLMTSGRAHPRPPSSSPPPPPADVEAEDALAFCWAFARMGMLDEVMVRELSRAVALSDERRAANVTQLDADGWQPFSKVLHMSAVYRKHTRILTFENFYQATPSELPL